MIKKLSVKLGLLFFVFNLLLESMLFFFLYFSIINERVQNEMDNLLSRGMSHRAVLEKNFDAMTIKHVALMETEADTMVVITDKNFQVLETSNPISAEKLDLIKAGEMLDFSHHGVVLESRWKTAPYLATVSPIWINENITGHVYMFIHTEPIKAMIQNLTVQFWLVGGVGLFFSIITIFFLSRFLTMPLIQMKRVTERLSEGESDVFLVTNREDELGDLAKSIQLLSNNLVRLKKERTDFLSSVSHELRTPLTYIKGYADILKRPNVSKEEHEEYVMIIQEEATNLTRLVKDLFDLAKMDQNVFSIEKERINLYEYLQDIVFKLKRAFEEKGIDLHYSCDKEAFISIDPIRFGQVIINLLDNALKYSSSSTTVSILVIQNRKQFIVKIIDQGFGIPKEEIPFIWDRLYRVDKSRSRATGGSGLGLTIAKEIIESHDGKITVESVVGEGTTFSIYLQGE